MKLPVKFRGRDLSGKLRFGFYAEDCNYPYIIERKTWYEVEVNSVKQLCGYDADGVEIYEDDTVYIDKDGYYREYTAYLKGYATNPKCYITLDGKFDARLINKSTKKS